MSGSKAVGASFVAQPAWYILHDLSTLECVWKCCCPISWDCCMNAARNAAFLLTPFPLLTSLCFLFPSANKQKRHHCSLLGFPPEPSPPLFPAVLPVFSLLHKSLTLSQLTWFFLLIGLVASRVGDWCLSVFWIWTYRIAAWLSAHAIPQHRFCCTPTSIAPMLSL